MAGAKQWLTSRESSASSLVVVGTPPSSSMWKLSPLLGSQVRSAKASVDRLESDPLSRRPSNASYLSADCRRGSTLSAPRRGSPAGLSTASAAEVLRRHRPVSSALALDEGPAQPMRDPSQGRLGFWLRESADTAGSFVSRASVKLKASLELRHSGGASLSSMVDLRRVAGRLRNFVDTPSDAHSSSNMGEEGASSSDAESLAGTPGDDTEYRELEERFGIVNRYDAGTEGQEVDPWENPNFEIYHITDRYGFMQRRNALHLYSSDGASPEKALAEALERERHKELRREAKWLRMLASWNKFAGRGKMRERVRKGIPDKLRAEVWRRLLGVPEALARSEGVYEELRSRARLLSKDIRQIDLDINRTYRNHLMFRKRYDIKQKSLLHVLASYAMYNTEVGYCQGMSQVAAVLLMYMDEEDAFWGLHALLCDQRHAMHGFFVPGFPKLLRYQEHYDRLLKKYHPRLRKHMVLERPMQEIKNSISAIQSRHTSRANSLAGMNGETRNGVSVPATPASSRRHRRKPSRTFVPPPDSPQKWRDESTQIGPKRDVSVTVGEPCIGSHSPARVSPIRVSPSRHSKRNPVVLDPPQVPTAASVDPDGFSRMPRSPSFYDNVPQNSEELRSERYRTRDGRTGLVTTYSRSVTSVETRRLSSGNSATPAAPELDVSYTPDHVTYVAIGPYGNKPSRQTVV